MSPHKHNGWQLKFVSMKWDLENCCSVGCSLQNVIMNLMNNLLIGGMDQVYHVNAWIQMMLRSCLLVLLHGRILLIDFKVLNMENYRFWGFLDLRLLPQLIWDAFIFPPILLNCRTIFSH